MRNLYRRGSGLTPRRLLVLVRGLPPTALVPQIVEQERARAEVERKGRRIEERQQHYKRAKGGDL